MNNKDLFNAINDIDEKFIEDAGKYLNDDDSDDPLHGKAVEILPKNTVRFSPIKLAASIAAAAVFITGVTFTVKHYRDKFGMSPNAASDAGTGEQDPDPELGTHAVNTGTGPLPFELIGPDGKQLWYDELTAFVTKEYPPDDYTSAVEITEDNWESVACNFAYYDLPNGINYNSVDNSNAEDLGDPDILMGRDFKRIYEGNVIGDLTVTKASCQLTRKTYTEPDSGETREVTYLAKNVIEFDGETTAEVYIVNNGDGNYACVFRSGADNFPVVGYDMGKYLKSGNYYSKINTLNCKNGFKYSGDMPVMWLDDAEVYMCETAMSNSNYVKAMATFTNITLTGTQDLSTTGFDINADISRVVVSYVDTVVTDDNLFGETPFDSETEMQLRSILGSATDIAELKANEEVKSLTGCDEIRVYKGFDLRNGTLGEEIFSGTLTSGNETNINVIALYDHGERVVAYYYFVYNLSKVPVPE